VWPVPKLHLTEGVVEGLKAVANKQITYFDDTEKNLALRISYGGTKAWLAVISVGKKTKWIKLGPFQTKSNGGEDTYPDTTSPDQQAMRPLTLKGARAAVVKVRAQKHLLLNTSPSKTLAKSSFEKVSGVYLEKHAAGFRSKPEIERCLKVYCYPRWKDRAFNSLKRSDVTALRADVADKHGRVQADRVFAIVRAVMRWFEAEGDDDDYICPVKDHKKKRGVGNGGRERVLSEAEIKLVWQAAGKLGPFGTLIKLLLLTAQRREKVVTVRWTDIEGDIWTIAREARQKSSAGMLKLPPFTLAILNSVDRVDDCSFVFAGRYGDKPLNSFSQSMKELRSLLPAEMPTWTLHDLRRTARTVMTDLGISDRVAEQVLGHAVVGIEGIYNRSKYLDQKADALQRLADFIEQLVDPGGARERKADADASTAALDDRSRKTSSGRTRSAAKSRQAGKRGSASPSPAKAKTANVEPA
jgi:integrase